MKTLPWFHMYSEARTDRKLATLSDREHRLWFNLLCLASEQTDRGTIPTMDCYLLGIEIGCPDCVELDRFLSKLEQLYIVSRDVTPQLQMSQLDEIEDYRISVRFLKFEERNRSKPSDNPDATRARKAAQRERDRGMSRPVTPRHALEEKRLDKNRKEAATPLPPKPSENPPQQINATYENTLNGHFDKVADRFARIDQQYTAGWLRSTLLYCEAQVGPLPLPQLGKGIELTIDQLQRAKADDKIRSPRAFARKVMIDYLTEQRDEHHAA
jgi:hypothetical protein